MMVLVHSYPSKLLTIPFLDRLSYTLQRARVVFSTHFCFDCNYSTIKMLIAVIYRDRCWRCGTTVEISVVFVHYFCFNTAAPLRR